MFSFSLGGLQWRKLFSLSFWFAMVIRHQVSDYSSSLWVRNERVTCFVWLLCGPVLHQAANQTQDLTVSGKRFTEFIWRDQPQQRCHLNPLTPELNPSSQRCLTRFFTGDFATWTVHFVNICVKNNKCTNYSFSLLIMCGSSYMFRHYIAIIRERS
jgi:hypothetical protein